jgi:hypothetical protein
MSLIAGGRSLEPEKPIRRVSLDPIRPLDKLRKSMPKTSESPNHAAKTKLAHQREASLNASPNREVASIFGKSSGFESYRA